MSEDPKPDFTPKGTPAPASDELPQGVNEFLAALKGMFSAAFEMHAPFFNRHPGVHENYEQIRLRLREIGFYASDSVNIMLHPERFRVPAPPAPPAPEEGKD